MTQRLIIIRGNSGSGKSTIAKQIHHDLYRRSLLIPQDVIRRDMLRAHDTPGNPAIELIHEIALYGKRIGFDVIIEGIMARARYGDMLRGLSSEFDQTLVYYFDITFDETLRRHNTKPNSHEFGEQDMRDWWLDHDALGVEGEVIITDDMSASQILSIIRPVIGVV